MDQPPPPQLSDLLQDMPAGPPTNRADSIPFFKPLEQLATKSAEQQKQDMLEVNLFFYGKPPHVTPATKQAIKDTIMARKKRTDGELFTAMRRIDHPDAKSEPCGKKISCGHVCEEPRAVPHECGLMCTSVKEFIRQCGHKTHIYCCRKESVTACAENCGKLVGCSHKCPNKCHYGTECPDQCLDYHCKYNLAQMALLAQSEQQQQ